MSERMGRLMALITIAMPIMAGCASNASQVRTRGALDLGCDLSNVSVQLTERPYVGVTRYEATGCGATRSYECRASFYSLGLPIGERTCKQAGGSTSPVFTPQGVTF